MSKSREAVFDFDFEGSVGEERFDDFNDFSQHVKGSLIIQVALVPDSDEGFLRI